MTPSQIRRSQPVRAGFNEGNRLGGRTNPTTNRNASATARLRDLQLERRIKRLGQACAAAQAAGNQEDAAVHWEQFRCAITERSPEQIERMEAKLGLRIRRQVKSALVLAFCHGWIPAAAVTTTFHVLQLHGV
ncbi:hypothetical protein [Dyella acidiphila]|uniref:Uncharacterized protein n=1 Tax=Dyella acidiphila TaxID=2775866 RepID=A0ABR9G6F5_9GAMM|nr:hypothetical protein [Dyella acidiphila]MBE1159634.1 hypothetical protein [Dyella acidiphila]